MFISNRVLAALCLAAAGLLALAPPAAAKTWRISIAKMAFGVVPDSVHPGDTIEWVNADIFRHTATAKDGSFDIDLEPNATATWIVKRAGTIEFFCKFHPGMTGRLVISGR